MFELLNFQYLTMVESIPAAVQPRLSGQQFLFILERLSGQLLKLNTIRDTIN
jgi:hypothetical protein